jgi:hypothetical protein
MSDVPLEFAVLCWGKEPVDWFEVADIRSYRFQRFPEPYKDVGAVFTAWRQADLKTRLLNLFGETASAMAGDHIPFDLVHKALLKIPEYRRYVLAHDIPGAEGEEGGMMYELLEET